jgi:hypothetical protein
MANTLLTKLPLRLDGEEPAGIEQTGIEQAGTEPSPAPESAATAAPAPARPALSLGEVAIGGAGIMVGLLAWAALGLAQLGAYRLWAALAVAVAAGAVLGVIALRVRPRPRIVVDRRELAVLLVIAAIAAWLNFPGFPYGLADKDPGVYVAHAVSIARTGNADLDDPVHERVPGFRQYTPGARFPGVWFEPNGDGGVRTFVQFYHLWPALLAAAWSVGELTVGGIGGLVNLNPLLGVLAVLAFVLVLKRAFGLLTGAIGGALLALNLIQVWQSRYQTAEVFTELLVMLTLLGILVALKTRWRPAAGLAGLALGLGFLARADTLLLMLAAVGAGAVLIVLGRFDGRAGWFAAGLALTLPHGLLQAYWIADAYTRANKVPSLPVVTGLAVGCLLAALILRRVARPLADRLSALLVERRAQLWFGVAITALAAVGMIVGFLRPRLFGPAYFQYNDQFIRSYDEQTFVRLSWFFTLPGMALLGAGIALVALRRWRAMAWTAVLPMLISLPIYAIAASNSSRLLWWNRRFVPAVAPGIIALIAVALVAGLLASGKLRLPVRVVAALGTVGLMVAFAVQSVPLRSHQEFAGSFQIVERIANLAGDRQGVFLFAPVLGASPQPASSLATPLWLRHGQIAGLIRTNPGADGVVPGSSEYVRTWQRAFPGQPVFVVTRGELPDPELAPLGLVLRDHVVTGVPMWNESNTELPSAAHDAGFDISVWEVSTPAGAAP